MNNIKKTKLFLGFNICGKARKSVFMVYKIFKYFPNSKFQIPNSKFNNNGFTLIELIIAMAIMSIFFAIIVPQYSKYINSRALSLAREQVVNDVRMAQNYAISTLKANGGFPGGGYGIRFIKDSNIYIIFADNDGDKIYKADDSEKFQDMEISGGIKINSLKIDGVANNPVDLVFNPPYGVTYINGVNKSGGVFIDLEIEIINRDSNAETIKIRSSGLIE